MSEQQTNNTAKRKLINYAIGCVIGNSIWAGAVATLNAVLAHAFLSHSNTSPGEVVTATILAWVITFGVAFFQGAIFICVFSAIGALVYSVFFADKSKGQ